MTVTVQLSNTSLGRLDGFGPRSRKKKKIKKERKKARKNDSFLSYNILLFPVPQGHLCISTVNKKLLPHFNVCFNR